MSNRMTGWKCSAFLALNLTLVPTVARASVTEITLKDIVARSDLIVVARVSKIEGAPAAFKQPAEDGMPAMKVATAQVIETWKGEIVREVRFIASPTRMCDVADAEDGERVVLFLTGRSASQIMMIGHVGRGRMPLREIEKKEYAALEHGVNLPPGAPTISRKRTIRLALPFLDVGPPEEVTLECDVSLIELTALRDLVKRAAAEKFVRPRRVADRQTRKAGNRADGDAGLSEATTPASTPHSDGCRR
jgi:hypothetical protein